MCRPRFDPGQGMLRLRKVSKGASRSPDRLYFRRLGDREEASMASPSAPLLFTGGWLPPGPQRRGFRIREPPPEAAYLCLFPSRLHALSELSRGWATPAAKRRSKLQTLNRAVSSQAPRRVDKDQLRSSHIVRDRVPLPGVGIGLRKWDSVFRCATEVGCSMRISPAIDRPGSGERRIAI
jgi:hypothetical protein